MNKCIYSKNDDSNATFDSVEHVFPKCIGGQLCLPKGTVSDQINNEFSRIELFFARENPIVVLSRMFYKKVGRKSHKNRDRIVVFKNVNTERITLGYMLEGRPICLDQIILPNMTENSIEKSIKCHVVISPSLERSNREKTNDFFAKLDMYNNCPMSIKSEKIPKNTYLIGFKDNIWFLGINNSENPEQVKPLLEKAIQKLVKSKDNVLCVAGKTQTSQSHVEANFEYELDLVDIMRVYAKIAFNSFAMLNTHEFILSKDFDDIRNAIYTGDGILDIACFSEQKNLLKPTCDRFNNKVKLGEQFHSVTFVTHEDILYAFVSLYGADYPVQVRIGPCKKHYTDAFICDWENQKDHKLIDYVVEVCKCNRDSGCND